MWRWINISTISALPLSVANWLSEQKELQGIKFLTEYPPQNKAVPLKKPTVAVGIKKASITDHFTESDDGVLTRDEYCRTANILIALTIHVPFSQGGRACHEVFTTIVDYLTFSSDFNISESACEDISSDRNTDALVMEATINVIADFCPAQEAYENFASFLDKELLCGSHIRDTDIHITSDEREFWNNRLMFGTYFGSGTSSKTIDLGFKPIFVVVFPVGGFPYFLSSDGSTTKLMIMTGYANESSSSYGIEIASNGFKAQNRTMSGDSLNVSYLNEAGSQYGYFAVKPVS